MNQDKLIERLRRVQQQVRAFRELHASELQIMLDELADISAELEQSQQQPEPSSAPSADPAAASPKRAKWLAEEAERSRPLSRRELLRGREAGRPEDVKP